MVSHKISATAFLVVLTIFFSSPSLLLAQYECDLSAPAQTIVGSLDVADPDQTTRVFRGGQHLASTCLANLAPTGAPLAGTFNYDAYNFTNTSGQAGCVTVELTPACGTVFIFAVAYSTYNPAAPNTGIIGNMGVSPVSGTTGSFSFPVAAGAPYTVVISETAANSGCPSYTLKVSNKVGCRQPGFDRDNDGSADYAVYRPAALSMWLNKPTVGAIAVTTRQFGTSGDIPIHGDYNGDGQTDLAVYRPSNSTFYIATNQATPQTSFYGVQWGVAGDIPVVGDYDRDGKNDLAVFRPSDGNWYVLRSTDNSLLAKHWGGSGDTPVSGDFDGDSAADMAIVRNINGTRYWFILLSNFGYTSYLSSTNTAVAAGATVLGIQWGLSTDILVPGDYTGDAKTDIAVWRPSDGTFYIRNSTSPVTNTFIRWGMIGDIPQPADYDNDKKTDAAVYRPSENRFYVLRSSDMTMMTTTLGQSGDQPVSAPYRVQ